MRNGHTPPSDDPGAAGPSPLRVPLACCWLLMLVTFSMPGREAARNAGGLDVIALAKLGVRGLVVLALVRELARCWDSPRRPAVVWCFAPFTAFLGWSLATAAWSPMKAVSLGQWGSLLAQVLLAAVIALRWEVPRDTSVLVRHLCLALAGIGGGITAIDLVSHDLSGLNRDEFFDDESTGLIHPTSAGATGSLGLVLLVAARLVWGWAWTRKLLVPGLLACAALLALAHSRTATAMTGIVFAAAFVRHSRVESLAGMAVAASLLLAAYLVADPGLTGVADARQATAEYARRGETDEQMSSLNGRGDLWEVIWAEFLHAPLTGHGYFLITRTGTIDVWSGATMLTAHNVLLQVLASTGLIGAALFLWALGRPIVTAAGRLRGGEEAGRVRAFLLLVGIWYLGWGQLCESFVGPVQPESVVFYCLLGLAVGQVRRAPGGENP